MADAPQTRESRRFFVSGLVQGVGYRYFAMRTAQRLGLAGYARNLPDGRVEVYAAGGAAKLAEFRMELERGPRVPRSQASPRSAPLNPEFVKRFSIEY